MPDLRVVTWNSSGEAGGRGQQLTQDVAFINNNAGWPDVEIVTIQEASVRGGTIAHALAQNPPFATQFVQPQGSCNEHLPRPAQPFRVAPSRAYRLSWMVNGPMPGWNLVGAGAGPALVSLDPATDQGVNNYINGLGGPLWQRQQLRVGAANIRWPVYQRLTRGAGNARQNIHFFTWHAPLRGPWLAVNLVHGAAFNGPALPEAFEFLQRSSFFTGIINSVNARGVNDVVVIAGDLNVTIADVRLPWMFPTFHGATQNLTHILAFSPSPNLTVNQNTGYVTPFPPHTILTARVHW